MNFKSRSHISSNDFSSNPAKPHRGRPGGTLRSSFRGAIRILAIITFLNLSAGSIIQASEFDLAEYYQFGNVGAAFEYAIADSDGNRLGTINEEVVEEGDGWTETTGQSTFTPPDQAEYTATFSYRHRKNGSGEFHLSRFEANTYRHQDPIVATTLEFEEPGTLARILSQGETRTTSIRFSMEQGAESESEVRTGTMVISWTFKGFEDVTVPAGAFSAARLEIITETTYDDADALSEVLQETAWVATGIGILRREFEASAGAPAVHELTGYTASPEANDPTDPPAPEEPLPPTFVSQDIGEVGHEGSAEWTQDGGDRIRVSGSGRDIWFEEDGFHFMHRKITGDGEIIVRYLGQDHTHNSAKAGIMVRESLSPDSRHASMTVNPEQTAHFIWRQETNGRTQANASHDREIPIWLWLWRNGDTLGGAYSNDLITWSELGSVTLSGLPESLYVGLAVTSKDNDEINEAQFDSLTLRGDGWLPDGSSDPTQGEKRLTAQNIGNVRHGGFSQYEEANDSITVTASGSGIRSRSDGFHFLHRLMEGDGTVTARIDSLEGSLEWARAGIMIRETLAPDSRHAMIVSTPLRSVSFQNRHESAGFTFDTTTWGVNTPVWLRLERQGDKIRASYSSNGTVWQHLETIELSFPDTVHVGLAYTSGDNNRNGSATFSSVSFPGWGTQSFDIVSAVTQLEPTAIDEIASDAPSTVSFASTSGTLNPVGADRFALYLNRTGKSDDPANIQYEIIGPGSEVIKNGMLPASNTIQADSDSGLIFFELNTDAFLPYDIPLMIHLIEGDGYRVGSADSVMFTIHSRPIDTWRNENFTSDELNDPTISGDSAAPAGDEFPNLIKYALGQDPTAPIRPEHRPSLSLSPTGTALEFERPAGISDIRYIVEVSSNLETWQSGDSFVELETIALGASERVIARDRNPTQEKQRFLRLRVERR